MGEWFPAIEQVQHRLTWLDMLQLQYLEKLNMHDKDDSVVSIKVYTMISKH